VLVLDGGIGMRSEVRDGVYTGRPDGPMTYREGKAEAIRALAAREGIDLSASYAYSDSESDLPMLRAVGHPVAVNPDAALERAARAEGWRIMRFDKLARRLRLTAAAAAGVLVAGGGGYLAARVRPPRPWRWLTR
jgi:phosphoserine phosphatase